MTDKHLNENSLPNASGNPCCFKVTGDSFMIHELEYY